MPLTWTLKQWLQTNRGLHFRTDRPLTDLKEFQEIIKQRTGNKISLLTLHKLLETQPKTLDYRILQLICDAYQCELKHFCAITASPPAPQKRRDVSIQHLLQPCAIAANESLRSFITRVRLAAISEAVIMTNNNFSQAARLLGSNRGTLGTIRRRNKHAAQTTPLSTDNAIPLPAAILTIKGNENFESFTRRIQLAAILETIKLEGNHTRAALRLGYTRCALVTLRYRLETTVQSLNP
jgi:DNA-binding protein Fis